MKTAPVNHSAGPGVVASEFLVICIGSSPGVSLLSSGPTP
jgi:hypothetical protein